MEKKQARLDDLYSWQHLERGFFDQIDNLLLQQPDAAIAGMKARRATAIMQLDQAQAENTSNDPEIQQINQIEAAAASDRQPTTTISSTPAPVAPLMATASTFNSTPAITEVTPTMSERSP